MESVGFEPFYKVGPVNIMYLKSKKNEFNSFRLKSFFQYISFSLIK